MDSLERDRELALVSLENAVRRCVKCGIPDTDLTKEFSASLTTALRRARVSSQRAAAKKGAGK